MEIPFLVRIAKIFRMVAQPDETVLSKIIFTPDIFSQCKRIFAGISLSVQDDDVFQWQGARKLLQQPASPYIPVGCLIAEEAFRIGDSLNLRKDFPVA